MKSIEKKLMVSNLDDAIDSLSKSIYLESPDLWIDFSDKMSDKIFDEMVLFFAAKYNALPIIVHAVENNLTDLDLQSRNKVYPSIRQHLITVAAQNGFHDIVNYLNGTSGYNTSVDSTESTIAQETISDNSNSLDEENTNYTPKYTCPKCNINIFESGYKVTDSIVYKFSSKSNKPVKVSNELLNSVVCCNCNNKIDSVTPVELENLCSVQNCSNCSSDLLSVGIIDKVKMTYDKESSRFTPKSTSYHCANCDKIINDYQKEHFGL